MLTPPARGASVKPNRRPLAKAKLTTSLPFVSLPCSVIRGLRLSPLCDPQVNLPTRASCVRAAHERTHRRRHVAEPRSHAAGHRGHAHLRPALHAVRLVRGLAALPVQV